MNTVMPAKNIVPGILPQIVQTQAIVSDAIPLGQVNQAELYVTINMGGMDHAFIALEVSPNGTEWYLKSILDLTKGTGTKDQFKVPLEFIVYILTADPNQVVSFVMDVPVCYPYLRVAMGGSGSHVGSSVSAVVGSGTV